MLPPITRCLKAKKTKHSPFSFIYLSLREIRVSSYPILQNPVGVAIFYQYGHILGPSLVYHCLQLLVKAIFFSFSASLVEDWMIFSLMFFALVRSLALGDLTGSQPISALCASGASIRAAP